MTLDADIITRSPWNVESSWDALRDGVTPVNGFYVRDHSDIPSISREAWSLVLRGFGRSDPLRFDDLARLRTLTHDVVLECAGNARTYFEPKVEGTPWRERAVACGRFTGARLVDVLDAIRVPAGTKEIVFRGAEKELYERSLPVEIARDPDVLLAWEMNGRALEPQHGAPVRLIVPRWYGVASVKWLVEMRASAEPFRGHYQTEKYVYAQRAGDPGATPVREKRVNSLVVAPRQGEAIGSRIEVMGWAWSGHAPIARVEVSVDGGRSWHEATLDALTGPYAWRGFRKALEAPANGAVVMSRAYDAAGNAQPEKAAWNVHGYGYNAPRPRKLG